MGGIIKKTEKVVNNHCETKGSGPAVRRELSAEGKKDERRPPSSGTSECCPAAVGSTEQNPSGPSQIHVAPWSETKSQTY